VTSFRTTRRRLVSLGTAALAMCIATTVVLMPARAATPVGDGQFHVNGINIIGPDGKVFVPRGVNVGGFDAYAMPLVNRDTFVRAKAWGANFVRLPISSTFWVQAMCSYNAGYVQRIDTVVQWAEELQILLLLDNHRSTKGLACPMKLLTGGQNEMADKFSQSMLYDIAARYNGRPYVAFDLFNEPHSISDEIWRNGGRVDTWNAIGMQELLDTVRIQAGATNLVFASGNSWANNLLPIIDNPLRGNDVVYAAHSYPFACDGRMISPKLPYLCHGKQYPPFLETHIAPAIGKRPVVITEFGTPRPYAGEMKAPIDWFNAHGIGWSAYNFASGKTENYALMQPNSTNPSITGTPVKNELNKLL
jgi:hypothetical protein